MVFKYLNSFIHPFIYYPNQFIQTKKQTNKLLRNQQQLQQQQQKPHSQQITTNPSPQLNGLHLPVTTSAGIQDKETEQSNNPNTEQDQFQLIDQKPHRKIYQNVKYHDQQIQKINTIKQYLKQKQPNKIYQDSFILKMIYLTSNTGTFNPMKIHQNIKKHQQWFQNTIITSSNRTQGRQILQQGVFYSYGRDNEYSPVIYFYPALIDTSKHSITDYYNALYTLLQPIQQHMLIPGVNEGINIVIDMQQRVSFNYLSLTMVKQMIEKVVFAYPYRLKRLFFVHTPQHNQLIKYIRQTLKQYNYQSKPQVITSMQQFRKYIPDQQRQHKYGGSLQDLNQYWPISLATKYQQEKSYFLVQNSSDTEYKSVVNQEILFQSVQQQEGFCAGYCGKRNCDIY